MKASLRTYTFCPLLLIAISFGGAAISQAQEPTTTPDANTCSIAGRITVDGQPRAGVSVELLKTTPNSSRRQLVTKVTTAKTGRYLFNHIPSGTYDVSPSGASLAVPNEGSNSQSGKSVVVDAGESLKDVDFKLVTTGSISGRVTDVNGRPVADETISLIIPGEHGYSRPFVARESADPKTDDTGGYHFSGVPPGRYLVRIGMFHGLPQFLPGEKERPYYPQTFHPNVTEIAEAEAVEVQTGKESTDVDITVGKPIETFEISGQVVDMTDAAIARVSLGLSTRSDRGSSDISGVLRSDANGQFKLRAVWPGHYAIYPERDPANNRYGDQVEFDLKDRDVTGLKIKMHRASTVSGIVTFEGSGTPLTADQIARLGLSPVYLARDQNSAGRSAKITPDGQFRIPGLKPGKIILDLDTHQAGVPEGFKIFRIERAGMPIIDGLEVQPDQDINDLRVVLGSGNCMLHGHVKIEGGPLEGVNLYVYYRATNADPHRFSPAGLDARGRFAVNGLMPGEYELTIGPMSVNTTGPAGSETMSRMPTVKQTITLVAGTSPEVELVLSLRPKQ